MVKFGENIVKKNSSDVGFMTTVLRKVGWFISFFHYFVEFPSHLKYGSLLLALTFYVLWRPISMIFMLSLSLYIQLAPRHFTSYLRLAIFYTCSKLPAQDIYADPILSINLEKTNFQPPQGRSGVLITGVTGFTGVHLFSHILKSSDRKVFCLIRNCDTREACIKKVMKTIKQFQMDISHTVFLDDRVQFIRANFKHKGLGISDEDWKRIANDVDMIYHNAASLTYAIPYEILREYWVENCVELCKFCYAHDIALHVMGSILGRCPKANPLVRSFWHSGYSRVNLAKELMMKRFYSQGLRGSFFEVGFIGSATYDESGACQKKNPVLALFVMGVECEAATRHIFNCIPVDLLVKLMWALGTDPKYMHIRHFCPSLGNVTGEDLCREYNKDMDGRAKVYPNPDDYLARVKKFGYRPDLVKHLILEIPFPNGVDDKFEENRELYHDIGVKDIEEEKWKMIRRSESYGRDTLRFLLK